MAQKLVNASLHSAAPFQVHASLDCLYQASPENDHMHHCLTNAVAADHAASGGADVEQIVAGVEIDAVVAEIVAVDGTVEDSLLRTRGKGNSSSLIDQSMEALCAHPVVPHVNSTDYLSMESWFWTWATASSLN